MAYRRGELNNRVDEYLSTFGHNISDGKSASEVLQVMYHGDRLSDASVGGLPDELRAFLHAVHYGLATLPYTEAKQLGSAKTGITRALRSAIEGLATRDVPEEAILMGDVRRIPSSSQIRGLGGVALVRLKEVFGDLSEE